MAMHFSVNKSDGLRYIYGSVITYLINAIRSESKIKLGSKIFAAVVAKSNVCKSCIQARTTDINLK